MISNIIDKRNRPYRWKSITAIMEPTCHDNSVADADEANEDELPAEFEPYDQLAEVSLAEAIVWAQAKPFEVTLYLYDLGEGIR